MKYILVTLAAFVIKQLRHHFNDLNDFTEIYAFQKLTEVQQK